MATRNRELEKRGVVLPKDDAENVKFLKAANDRGGIVFVSEDAKKEFDGNV